MIPNLETVATACGDAITGLEKLEIYQRYCSKLEDQILANNQKADTEIKRIQQEAADANKPLQEQLEALRAMYEPSAKDFIKLELAKAGGKSKTFKTPWGAYSFKTTGGGLKIKDAVACLTWAQTFHPELVHQPPPKPVEPTVQVSALKPWFESHQDELPAGCVVEPSVEAFTYKPLEG